MYLEAIHNIATFMNYYHDFNNLSFHFSGYNSDCDGTVVNEFSAAAFRFGHSLLRPVFRRVDANYKEKLPPVRLRDHFFKPAILYQENMVEDLMLGLLDTPMETLDNFITGEVTNHLFERKGAAFSGMDLVSLNMQRGMDFISVFIITAVQTILNCLKLL